MITSLSPPSDYINTSRVALKATRLSDGLVMLDLEHRRLVAALCIFYKIHCIPNYNVHVPAWLTRLAVSVHSRYLNVPKRRTVHSGRSLVPMCVQSWNSLDEPCLAGEGAAAFKSRINRALLLD